jgi:hypothetical protein
LKHGFRVRFLTKVKQADFRRKPQLRDSSPLFFLSSEQAGVRAPGQASDPAKALGLT